MIKRSFNGPRKSGPSRAPQSSGFGSGPRRSGGGFRGASNGGFRGGPSRGGFRGGSRGGGSRQKTEKINFSKFINKVQMTEEVAVFKPEHTFQDFKIVDALKESIRVKGYLLPTPIQDRTIPQILMGNDIVGVANTGTGKTAAFLIPLINKVLLNRQEQVLIIVPTRELAIQIDDELKQFTKNMQIYSVCCVGGAPIYRQISELRLQYNFIIGTPGRLKDLIDRKMIHLHEFKSIVLDEADRMLDMGFVHDMRAIMKGMPKERHTLFFSATISPDIERLITEFLKNPLRISVKTQDTAKNIEQDVIQIKKGENKTDVLCGLLDNKELTKVLIFGRTKHGVEKLSQVLTKKGIKAESIHGDKTHGKRQYALKLFKENYSRVLVATDVAARGLDISDISHVINYDIPATNDDYVHRIGRTGRGAKKGKAITFVE
ncbi:MAG: DEAD/DEAH box helicase [Candidatus Paceibacterota bacterium]|jgi:superfamily II DNA/RNA helicase